MQVRWSDEGFGAQVSQETSYEGELCGHEADTVLDIKVTDDDI